MFCTKCGKENKEQSKFCEYCGAKLETPSPRSGDAGAVEDQHGTAGGRKWPGPKGAGGKPTDPAGDSGKKNHVPLLVGLVALVLATGVGIGLGAHYLMNRDSEKETAREEREQERTVSSAFGDQPDKKDSDKKDMGQKEAGAEKTPTATAAPTSEPAPSEAPKVTVTAAPTPELKAHTYELIVSDGGWEEAFNGCIARGGYLATIETLEEFEEITAQIEAQGLSKTIFYIGGGRGPQSNVYSWVDSDRNFLTANPINDISCPINGKWLSGEPSFQDGEYEELYLTMYYNSDVNGWVLNDVPEDVVDIWPNYAGRIGYICEYEN